MRQMALQLKMKIRSANIMNDNMEASSLVLNAMLTTLLLLGLSYTLILGNMVFNIVARRALEKEALSLSNEVNQLELSYLNSIENIDVNLSSKMGFVETRPSFVTRKSFGSLSLVHNEI